MCESKDTESPRIVIFLKNEELRKISIAGNGVVADVHAVVAVAVAGVGAIANLDDVFAVLWGDERYRRVLQQQRRIVGGRELETVGVQDRDIRIEEGRA